MRPHRLRTLRHLRHLRRPDDDHDGQQQTSTTRRPDEAAALHHLHQITTPADRTTCAPSAPPHTAADRAAYCLRLAPPAPPR